MLHLTDPPAPSAEDVIPAGLDGVTLMMQRMRAAFARATAERPDAIAAYHFAFAGRPVRLRVVGRELAEALSRGFAHLASSEQASTEPRLSIDVWDQRETGVLCPADPAEEPGASRVAEDGCLSSSLTGRLVTFRRERSMTCLDRLTGHIVEWRPSAAGLSLYECTKPFRLILRLWFADHGVHFIHAGLVARDGRGALLAGAGGAGKSTTALACLCAGLDYLGDDYIALEEQPDGSFVGHSLYSSARLEPDHLARFETLRPHAVASRDPRDRKSLLFLSELLPGQVARAAGIRVVLLPRVVDAAAPSFSPASKGQALFALAPSTLIAALGPGAPGLARLARLVDRVPTYWLRLGRDVDRIPDCVERVLSELPA